MKFMQMLLIAVLALVAAVAGAQPVANDGYARDLSEQVWKNPFGLCWRTSQWTEVKAIADCDPDAAPKPIVRAVQAPAARPAPVAPVLEPKVAEAPKVVAPAPIAAAPLAPAPMPVRARTQTITLGADASFDTGKADLKAEGQAKLDALAKQLHDVSFDAIRVVGHTDNVGTDVANQRLSLRRANAVKAYLASHGVDPAKVQTTGRGKTAPVADNKTAQGRARNRRVEVEIRGTRTL